jgi:Transcriptional regulators
MSSKRLGYFLERTTRRVKLAFTKAFLAAGIDLTPEQWVILDYLMQSNGLSQKDIADKSYKNAPTVSRIVDVLERKGIVERHRFDNDRRRYKIYLTDKGQAVGLRALPIAQELRNEGWKGLDDADYDHFLKIVETVFDNFE